MVRMTVPEFSKRRCTSTIATSSSIIASSSGANGSNFEYLENTVRALHELGVPDPDLDLLHQRVCALRSTGEKQSAAKTAAD